MIFLRRYKKYINDWAKYMHDERAIVINDLTYGYVIYSMSSYGYRPNSYLYNDRIIWLLALKPSNAIYKLDFTNGGFNKIYSLYSSMIDYYTIADVNYNAIAEINYKYARRRNQKCNIRSLQYAINEPNNSFIINSQIILSKQI